MKCKECGDVCPPLVQEGFQLADGRIVEEWKCSCPPIEDPKLKDHDTKFELFFPPPWNMNDFPEKTEGWIEFQREMRNDPQYYLGDFLLQNDPYKK